MAPDSDVLGAPPEDLRAASAVKPEADADAVAEFEQFKRWRKDKAAGRITVKDRPTLYACANSHFAEEKDTDAPAPGSPGGMRICREDKQPMGIWPGNIEPVQRNHYAGDDHR